MDDFGYAIVIIICTIILIAGIDVVREYFDDYNK